MPRSFKNIKLLVDTDSPDVKIREANMFTEVIDKVEDANFWASRLRKLNTPFKMILCDTTMKVDYKKQGTEANDNERLDKLIPHRYVRGYVIFTSTRNTGEE